MFKKGVSQKTCKALYFKQLSRNKANENVAKNPFLFFVLIPKAISYSKLNAFARMRTFLLKMFAKKVECCI